MPRIYLGAYAICIDADRLLLSRVRSGYPDAGRWTLPGGGLDWGEEPDAGALRELEEETGLVAESVDELIAVYSHAYPEDDSGSGVHHVGVLYRVRGFAGRIRPEVEGSSDLCGWFTKDEAVQLPLTPLGSFGVKQAWNEETTR